MENHMKNQKFNKVLMLKKTTISNLNSDQMNAAKGGGTSLSELNSCSDCHSCPSYPPTRCETPPPTTV